MADLVITKDEVKRINRLGRVIQTQFQTLDAEVAEALRPFPVSCKVGCTGCCYQFVMCSLPEAVAIVGPLLGNKQFAKQIPELTDRLFKQLEGLSFELDREAYFAKKIPCAFLDTERKLCTVYPLRPAACRYYFVLSDPAACYPGSSEFEVALVDTLEVQYRVLAEAQRVSKQVGLALYVAPLPVMVLWALKLLVEGVPAFHRLLEKPEPEILDLKRWGAWAREHLRDHVVPKVKGGSHVAEDRSTSAAEPKAG